jgi:hypothetical protein
VVSEGVCTFSHLFYFIPCASPCRYARMPPINNKGDELLKMSLFWSLFMPLAETWCTSHEQHNSKKKKKKKKG